MTGGCGSGSNRSCWSGARSPNPTRCFPQACHSHAQRARVSTHDIIFNCVYTARQRQDREEDTPLSFQAAPCFVRLYVLGAAVCRPCLTATPPGDTCANTPCISVVAMLREEQRSTRFRRKNSGSLRSRRPIDSRRISVMFARLGSQPTVALDKWG